jgi:hypothetical protein
MLKDTVVVLEDFKSLKHEVNKIEMRNANKTQTVFHLSKNKFADKLK